MKKYNLSAYMVLVLCVFFMVGWSFSPVSLHNDAATWAWYGKIQDYLNELKSDVNTNLSLNKTKCFDFADLDIAPTTTAYETNNTVDYCIDNVMYQKAAFTGAVSGTALANNQKCLFLITLDSSGSATATQSSIVASTEAATLPAIPSDECPIGYIQVSTAGAVFTPGTTDLSAANVTDTYVELHQVNSGSSAQSSVSATDLNRTSF